MALKMGCIFCVICFNPPQYNYLLYKPGAEGAFLITKPKLKRLHTGGKHILLTDQLKQRCEPAHLDNVKLDLTRFNSADANRFIDLVLGAVKICDKENLFLRTLTLLQLKIFLQWMNIKPQHHQTIKATSSVQE